MTKRFRGNRILLMKYGIAGWALLALVCVLSMFFFPAPRGSFQSVHGPTTTLRSLRLAVLLLMGMAMAALSLFGRAIALLLRRLGADFSLAASPGDAPSLQQLCTIRC